MRSINKKGEKELISNFIWVILSLIFLAMMVLFVDSKADSSARLEEKYAKQIALILDNAKPGMNITIDMLDAYILYREASGKSPLEVSFKDGKKIIIRSELVNINGETNTVTVKIRPNKAGFSYHFFNNINVNVDPELTRRFKFIVGDYK